LFFAAQATLRGMALELCVLLMFWLSKDASSLIGEKPREAIANLPEIRSVLEAELADWSPTGRIPRAIMGRYLSFLYYFGEEWVKAQIGALLPENEDTLRHATFRSHIRHGQGPIGGLVSLTYRYYAEEIARLTSTTEEPDRHFREDCLADHVIILHLWGALPDDVLEQFWRDAPIRVLQHALGFLGQQLQLRPSQLPDEMRARGFSYWERRLAAAKRSANIDSFREELGSIGQWCFSGEIDEQWLSDQLMDLLGAGFVPTDAFSVVEWLQKISARAVDRAVEILELLLNNPRLDRWAYMTQTEPIRSVLSEGLSNGTTETVGRVKEIISFLASIGETSYLDLLPPPPAAQ
jgi:hypothetical protein